MKGIADTGFIVAFGNRTDRHHIWAVDLAKTLTEPLLTCEAVLAEAAFHLGSSAYVLALLQDDMLRLAFDCTRNLEQLGELAERYEDRKPDLADLCLVRMSELSPPHRSHGGRKRFPSLSAQQAGSDPHALSASCIDMLTRR